MGSTGEADRKRRHFSTISPTAAKRQPLVPLSEEKKLDAAVLKFQNQKLTQKLETQKIEINSLADRSCQLNDKQQSHEKTLTLVNNTWDELVDDLELRTDRMTESVKCARHLCCQIAEDGKDARLHEDCDSPPEDAFLSRLRLLETGATESSSSNQTANPSEGYRQIDCQMEKTVNLVSNVLASLNDLNYLKNKVYAASLKATSSTGHSQIVVSSDLLTEVKNLRTAVAKLHSEHKSVYGKLQSHRDIDAKNKSDFRRLKGELGSSLTELEESNRDLAILRVEREMTKGESPRVLNKGTKNFSGEKAADKLGDSQDMESTLKELSDQSTSSLHELKRLHGYKLDTLRQLSVLQSKRKSVKFICTSQAYVSLKDQLANAKADVVRYQTLSEKQQVEKESLVWREKEAHLKTELVDVLHQSSTVADSRISELEVELEKYNKEKGLVKNRLAEASKETGRKEIIAEFKALVSSFPEKMGSMQNQLATHKVAAANIHCLRADVQSLTNIFDRKVKELNTLTSRKDQLDSEIQKLHELVHDLELTKNDLNIFLDMYGHESTDSREVSEARNSEIKAWAHVHSLKSSLDEHSLELQVKDAIEAEAKAQQRLAATEAEIADLRLKLDASKREKVKLSDVLKSKHEETEAYLSEIESIGQAYDDMQTQNQQLLQQVTERDDYNIKLVLEGVKARQTGDTLLMEKHTLQNDMQRVKTTVDFYEYKVDKIEDQLKAYTDHIKKLAEDRLHNTAARENTLRRLLDVRKSSQQLMHTLEETQLKVDNSRTCHAEMQIELEKERFERKRVEEDLETLRRKAQQLRSEAEGNSIAEKLKEELREYKEILKCSVCLDRRKEVVITKCYHLFCNPCVQRVIDSRHRKCPVCSASFGANDVKPVYI